MKIFSFPVLGLALAFATFASLPADAKSFTLGDPPIAVIEFPDSWSPRETDDGVEGTAPGEGAYVAAEAVDIADVATATREGIEYFQKEGIKLDPSSMKQREIKVGDFDAIDVTWTGKDEDGPTNASLTFVIVSDKQSVLLYLWGTDDDLSKAANDLKAIAGSLKAVKR